MLDMNIPENNCYAISDKTVKKLPNIFYYIDLYVSVAVFRFNIKTLSKMYYVVK